MYIFTVESKVQIKFVLDFFPAQEYCSSGLPKSEKKKYLINVVQTTEDQLRRSVCIYISMNWTKVNLSDSNRQI